MNDSLEFQNWGLIDYEEAVERQLGLVEKVHLEQTPGYLIFCTHPPVVTLGRSTSADDVTDFTGKKIEVSRGGRATYHGPSQIIVYPILNLKEPRKNRKPREVVGFLRDFENAIVDVLKSYELKAQGRSLQKKSDQESTSDETGVWVGEKKLASLGIAVKKWVTYHGAAINFDRDPKAHQGIRPCGFEPSVMTSIEELLGKAILRSEFETKLKTQLLQTL
jgi:lipoyl(octanoyl) transferase